MTSIRHTRTFRWLASLWGVASALGVALTIILAAPFGRSRQTFFRCSTWWVRQQLKLFGITWSVEGWETLPESIRNGEQPVVFMPNHGSLLDPPFVLTALPLHPVFIAKKEIRLIPLIGWAVACAGMIYIDRGSRERAIASLKRAAQEVRAGKSVVIFPEGTRTRNGRLQAFKKGGFHLAEDAGVPIVPVAIRGAFEILPKGSLLMKPGQIQVRVGTPIPPSSHEGREAQMAEVRSQLEALLGQA